MAYSMLAIKHPFTQIALYSCYVPITLTFCHIRGYVLLPITGQQFFETWVETIAPREKPGHIGEHAVSAKPHRQHPRWGSNLGDWSCEVIALQKCTRSLVASYILGQVQLYHLNAC